MDSTKKYAVIVAGGKGVRMDSNIPKQFLPVNGMPVICHTVLAFSKAFSDINIILVVPEGQIDSANTILKTFIGSISVTIVPGGETRFHSVQNGLEQVNNDGVVFIHDGVRPLVTTGLIQRCYEQALLKGSAIPSLAVTDSIRMMDDDGKSHPVNRDKLRSIQTPQTFRTAIILQAFKQPYQPSFTDEATVVEAYGKLIFMAEGEYSNIKVTTPGDLAIVESLLKARS